MRRSCRINGLVAALLCASWVLADADAAAEAKQRGELLAHPQVESGVRGLNSQDGDLGDSAGDAVVGEGAGIGIKLVAKLQADLGKAAEEAKELKAQLAVEKARCATAGITPSSVNKEAPPIGLPPKASTTLSPALHNLVLQEAPNFDAVEETSQCGEAAYGYMVNQTFVKGNWSRPIAVGFKGISLRAEQYQVSPPGCNPPECISRIAPDSATAALEAATCPSSVAFPPLTISAGQAHTCATTQGGRIVCWGSDAGFRSKPPMKASKETPFSVVSTGYLNTCGLTKEKAEIKCWGDSGYKQVTGMTLPKGKCGHHNTLSYCAGLANTTKFSAVSAGGAPPSAVVSAGGAHTCGLTKEKAEIKCWGWDKYKQVSGMTKGYVKLNVEQGVREDKDGNWYYQAGLASTTKFSAVSAGVAHTCGLTKEKAEIKCWGFDGQKQVSGMTTQEGKCGRSYCAGLASTTEFSAVSAGYQHTCGLTKEKAEIKCWGFDAQKQVSGGLYRIILRVTVRGSVISMTLPKGECGRRSYCASPASTTKFSAVSAGYQHTCGLTKEPIAVVCWGLNKNNNAAVPTKVDVLGTIKWLEEKSCQSAHEEISGPASCTSCDPKGCNKHFTIMDPATNTGTCTAKMCPMCKPSTCCPPGHKHYVINTDNMEGVCVRHTDDCTAVCMPRGKVDPEKRRVCSKGCNKKLKVPKSAVAPGATTDAEFFDIVVCQVQWRIVCDKGACKTSKGVDPIARCGFSSDVWNSGATCIANHVQKDKHPKCPEKLAAKAAENMKEAGCRKATFTNATTAQQLQKLGDDTDVGACKKLADALAEYY